MKVLYQSGYNRNITLLRNVQKDYKRINERHKNIIQSQTLISRNVTFIANGFTVLSCTTLLFEGVPKESA